MGVLFCSVFETKSYSVAQAGPGLQILLGSSTQLLELRVSDIMAGSTGLFEPRTNSEEKLGIQRVHGDHDKVAAGCTEKEEEVERGSGSR